MRFWLHFDLNVFSIVVWILSQLTAFVLKLQQKYLHGQKSTVWKTVLILNIYLLECCLLYLAVEFFTFFNKSDGGFYWNGLSICAFTNTINNSAQLKDRDLRLLLLFLLIILEMCSSAALECAAFVCFLRKLCVWEKICSKFVKPWEMKKPSRDLEKSSETMWHTVKPWELRGLNLFSLLPVFSYAAQVSHIQSIRSHLLFSGYSSKQESHVAMPSQR